MVDDCFTEMLSCWLKRSTPPPSWSELKEALNSPVIGRGDIAKEITGDNEIASTSTVKGWTFKHLTHIYVSAVHVATCNYIPLIN